MFRARFVTTVHALAALTEVLERHPELAGRTGVAAIQEVLDAPASRYLASDAVRHLRNRCMHYGIPGHLENLTPSAPAYGPGEATTDSTYDVVNNQVLETLTALSNALKAWAT